MTDRQEKPRVLIPKSWASVWGAGFKSVGPEQRSCLHLKCTGQGHQCIFGGGMGLGQTVTLGR